jgi:hypothetical protein
MVEESISSVPVPPIPHEQNLCRTLLGLSPVVELSRKVYQKGISLGKAAMQAVEKRLKRHPALPKYDILINPAPTS